MNNRVKNCKMGSWNITSLHGKEFELIEEVETNKLDILGITETKKKRYRWKRIKKQTYDDLQPNKTEPNCWERSELHYKKRICYVYT